MQNARRTSQGKGGFTGGINLVCPIPAACPRSLPIFLTALNPEAI